MAETSVAEMMLRERIGNIRHLAKLERTPTGPGESRGLGHPTWNDLDAILDLISFNASGLLDALRGREGAR